MFSNAAKYRSLQICSSHREADEVPCGAAQRVSRAVSLGFMEMLREQQAAIEGGAGWADVAALLQADPRLQARRPHSGNLINPFSPATRLCLLPPLHLGT